jgi:CCR4-NOT transcription complex subunit 7/8
MLKLIQLGLTFTDARGRLPRVGGERAVWQFNIREFRLGDDMYAQDSIDLLKTSGIDFNRMEGQGCDVHRFGELLMTSGVVLSDEINWVTFHSGYDFGYLLKLLTCAPLPPTEAGFFELLNLYFPALYDIKYLMKFCGSLHGGLNKLAETLEVERIGPQHQAGSDSLLTAATFLKLAATFFNKNNNNSSNGVSKRKGDKDGSGGSGSDESESGDDGDGDDKKGVGSSSNGRGTGGLGGESKNATGGGGKGGATTAENVLAGLEEHRGILYGLGSDGANEAPQD